MSFIPLFWKLKQQRSKINLPNLLFCVVNNDFEYELTSICNCFFWKTMESNWNDWFLVMGRTNPLVWDLEFDFNEVAFILFDWTLITLFLCKNFKVDLIIDEFIWCQNELKRHILHWWINLISKEMFGRTIIVLFCFLFVESIAIGKIQIKC